MGDIKELFSEAELKRFDDYPSSGIEMRGIWHMPHSKSGYDETNLEGVVKLLDDMADVGINTIFIETTINGFTVYPTRVGTFHQAFSKYDYGAEYGHDYLQCFLSEAHRRRLKVHAWTTVMRAGRLDGDLSVCLPSPVKEEWLARGYHGEYGLDGKYGILIWLDPSNPEVIDYLLKKYQELLDNYDFDGIELDAIRYPVSNLARTTVSEELSDFGYTEGALGPFLESTGFSGDFQKEIVNNPTLKEEWIQYRSSLITHVVAKIHDLVRSHDCMMPFSAAVFPDHAHAKSMVCQDWKTWLEKGWFDFISPMAYYHDADKVRKSYEETEALVSTGAFNLQGLSSIINDGNYQTHLEQAALINEEGGLGSILFSIRQFVKDQLTCEMVRYINQKHPAISPLEPLEDIIRFMASSRVSFCLCSCLSNLPGDSDYSSRGNRPWRVPQA
jgi:uncharacterized lipoprotein YddW (UPF0748 family)